MYDGPTRPSPFDPWQLAHPEPEASSCPAAASGVRTTSAELELELHDVNKLPTKNNETHVKPANFKKLFFKNIGKQYSPSQVEFAIVVLIK